MPRLTIIVPLMDQVDTFETTLASVLRYAGPQVEVLAAVTGDYEDQYNILGEISSVVVDARLASTSLGRAAWAADAATSTWIYWLAPGIELTQTALAAALEMTHQRDLGLASPKIAARQASSLEPNQVSSDAGEQCLASSVVMTERFHPVCLEELVGEQWTAEDVSLLKSKVAGPTGWAGLVQRQLLEQWPASHRRLPAGYAELSLGLMVQDNGWAHDWIDGELVACETIAPEIEAGFRLCGRSSNRILELATASSRVSLRWTAVQTSVAEVARGCLSPKLWRVAWERLMNLSSLGRRRSDVGSHHLFNEPSDEMEREHQNIGVSERATAKSANRSKSIRSAA